MTFRVRVREGLGLGNELIYVERVNKMFTDYKCVFPSPSRLRVHKGKGSHKRERNQMRMLAGNDLIDDSGKERMMDDRGK